MITVVNRHTFTGVGTYIGRGTIFGNAFGLDTYGRKKAIAMYRKDKIMELEQQPDGEFAQALRKLQAEANQGDIFLICSCKPKDCHGDIIVELIEDYL